MSGPRCRGPPWHFTAFHPDWKMSSRVLFPPLAAGALVSEKLAALGFLPGALTLRACWRIESAVRSQREPTFHHEDHEGHEDREEVG
jgi:hypothetical protein